MTPSTIYTLAEVGFSLYTMGVWKYVFYKGGKRLFLWYMNGNKKV